MSFLEWTEELSVQVPEMDRQHQDLIGVINELHDVMSDGKSLREKSTAISRLLKMAEWHFVNEEAMMYRISYPQLQAHRTAHRRLIARVLEYKSDFDHPDSATGPELLLFVKNWLIAHIQEADRDYAQYVVRCHVDTQKLMVKTP